ncbi:MAG: hypothetical protein JO223_02200 [Hyphomicrobiales bacterium]|nr:hypothetical protein [Hyphomicrobiales bacterium]MBV8443812.1 hypothetical protein [Hyphomicrobiales bacterium]
MTVRSMLTIAALAGLGILASPGAGVSETRVLSLGGDALGSLQEQPATSIPTDWKIEVQAPLGADASAPDGGDPNQRPDSAADFAASAVATNPGAADLEAARVAAPPQSGLKRMLSAVIDLGSAANSKR